MKPVLLTLIILFAHISKGQPLSTYYSSLEGKYTEGLKTATHLVIKVHLRLSYTALWKYFQQTDCMPNDTLRIWDMYSNNTTYFSDYSTLHKEHQKSIIYKNFHNQKANNISQMN